MAILEADIFCIQTEFIYVYSGSFTVMRFKHNKAKHIFIKMTSFDEVHTFDSEHSFFTLEVIFDCLLRIVSF